jgi:hypothetical protein
LSSAEGDLVTDSSDRVALPIRVHEFMLACAGRIDDDALTDARELLAVAELDRAVDLLAASLVAGRIPLSADERDNLVGLTEAVRSSPALASRITVVDEPRNPRHRFTVGQLEDPAPEDGVLAAIGRVVEVLPDIRSVSCVWRTTPAGAAAGPVPQRLVLVETGPEGFAPSTAYRVEQALRRAGVRAAVEVVQAGADLHDYHADALHVARRLPLRTASSRSVDVADDAGRESSSGSLFTDPPAAVPRTATSTRRRGVSGAHADRRPTEEISTAPSFQGEHARVEPARVEPVRLESVPPRVEQAPAPPMPPPAAPVAPPAQPVAAPTSLPVDGKTVEPITVSTAESAHMAETQDATTEDADLSNRERELLRQLHEELAKRENTEPVEPDVPVNSWQVDRSGQRHSGYPTTPTNAPSGDYTGSWQQRQQQRQHRGADQTAVNGIPPYGASGG